MYIFIYKHKEDGSQREFFLVTDHITHFGGKEMGADTEISLILSQEPSVAQSHF